MFADRRSVLPQASRDHPHRVDRRSPIQWQPHDRATRIVAVLLLANLVLISAAPDPRSAARATVPPITWPCNDPRPAAPLNPFFSSHPRGDRQSPRGICPVKSVRFVKQITPAAVEYAASPHTSGEWNARTTHIRDLAVALAALLVVPLMWS